MRRLLYIFKKAGRALAKKHPLLRAWIRRCMYVQRRILYLIRGIGVKIEDRTVLFESYNGGSYACSPKAIYEYMIDQKEFAKYRFIWIFKEPEQYGFLEQNPNTRLVKYRSKACEQALAKAKYWIFNYRALDHWIPKKGQVYIQCWHGTPLKRLGYDIEKSDNAMNSLEEIRDKYRQDAKRFRYLLSPCAFATEKFRSAWNLEAFGKEDAILEIGYPRNDFLVNHTPEDVHRIRDGLGLAEESRKIILYAPTWRDNQHHSGLGYTYENKLDFGRLQEELEGEAVILFRAHYLVGNSFDFERYEGFVYDVSNVDDINELYVVADMLITDYSSVFFDYAILERPILFYMYDLEEYRDEMRGFYLGLKELPGKVVTEVEELVEAINRVEPVIWVDEKYRLFNRKFNYLNDGQANRRMIEKIQQEAF